MKKKISKRMKYSITRYPKFESNSKMYLYLGTFIFSNKTFKPHDVSTDSFKNVFRTRWCNSIAFKFLKKIHHLLSNCDGRQLTVIRISLFILRDLNASFYTFLLSKKCYCFMDSTLLLEKHRSYGTTYDAWVYSISIRNSVWNDLRSRLLFRKRYAKMSLISSARCSSLLNTFD